MQPHPPGSSQLSRTMRLVMRAPELSVLTTFIALEGRWAGRRCTLYNDGTVLPVVAGGSDTQPPADPPKPPDNTPPADPPKPADPPAPTGPTQADVNRAKAEAKRAAEQAIADQLGCSIDEAKQIIEAKRKADDDAKDAVTRAQEAEAAAKAEADRIKADGDAERQAMRVERALLVAGVPIEEPKEVKDGEDPPKTKLDRARVQILADLPTDADDAAIKAAVDALKADVPAFFGAAPAGGTPSSVPAGAPPGGQPAKSGIEAGRERARRERAERENRPKFMEGLAPLGSSASTS